MRFQQVSAVLAFHFLTLGVAASAWSGHRELRDSESIPSPADACGVVVEVATDPICDELGDDAPTRRLGSGRSLGSPACGKRQHLRPLFSCKSDDGCQGSASPGRAVGVPVRQSPIGLLNMWGFHSRPGSSAAGQVPGPGMPPVVVGPRPSGGAYPNNGGMLQEYPAFVSPGTVFVLSRPPGAAALRLTQPTGQGSPASVLPSRAGSPMEGPLLPNVERLPSGTVRVPDVPTPPAVPPQTTSSTAHRAVQNASLEAPFVELNTPDKAIGNRLKPSSKFEPITP